MFEAGWALSVVHSDLSSHESYLYTQLTIVPTHCDRLQIFRRLTHQLRPEDTVFFLNSRTIFRERSQ